MDESECRSAALLITPLNPFNAITGAPLIPAVRSARCNEPHIRATACRRLAIGSRQSQEAEVDGHESIYGGNRQSRLADLLPLPWHALRVHHKFPAASRLPGGLLFCREKKIWVTSLI